jgi:hypothetical protein
MGAYSAALLDRLAKEAAGAGVTDELYSELIDAHPDPSATAPFIVALVPHCSPLGRFGVAELAMHLLKQDRGFRPAVRAAISGWEFDNSQFISLQWIAMSLTGDDYLWWFDLCYKIGFGFSGQTNHYPFRKDLLDLLIQHRCQELVDYLASPECDPGSGRIEVLAEVLSKLGRCPPLERQWSKWIRDGRFIKYTKDAAPGNADGGSLGMCLQDVLRVSPDIAYPLVGQAMGHWRTLLASRNPGQRREVMQTMGFFIQKDFTLDGRLPRLLFPASMPGSPERDLIERAFAANERALRTKDNSAEDEKQDCLMALLTYGD